MTFLSDLFSISSGKEQEFKLKNKHIFSAMVRLILEGKDRLDGSSLGEDLAGVLAENHDYIDLQDFTKLLARFRGLGLLDIKDNSLVVTQYGREQYGLLFS
jgi:hypothetical protein